jgi:hypothetical protein
VSLVQSQVHVRLGSVLAFVLAAVELLGACQCDYRHRCTSDSDCSAPEKCIANTCSLPAPPADGGRDAGEKPDAGISDAGTDAGRDAGPRPDGGPGDAGPICSTPLFSGAASSLGIAGPLDGIQIVASAGGALRYESCIKNCDGHATFKGETKTLSNAVGIAEQGASPGPFFTLLSYVDSPPADTLLALVTCDKSCMGSGGGGSGPRLFDQMTPAVGIFGGHHMAAASSSGGLYYVECVDYAKPTTDCSQGTSWTFRDLAAPAPGHHPGFATGLGLQTGHLGRALVARDRILFCDAVDCSDPGAVWTAVPLPEPADVWSEMAIDSVDLGHLAALSSAGHVMHGRCTSHPCNDPVNWSFDVIATDVNPSAGQIGFQIDSSGKGRLVYSNALGVLTELREGGGGSPWTSRSLQDCGATIVGTHPAFLLDEQDSMRLVYADSSGVRYIVAP